MSYGVITMSWLKRHWLDVGRYKVHKRSGYKVHRGFVKVVCLFLVAYLLFSFVWALTHDRYYLHCPGPDSCDNPLYGAVCKGRCPIPEGLFLWETLPPGFVAGYDVPWYFEDAPSLAVLLLFASLFLHHHLYNKGFSFERLRGVGR